jgi:hypothetical protein
MTPEQAKRLGELHEAEIEARWAYWRGAGDNDTWEKVQAASRAFYTYLNSITERSPE